MKILLKMLIAEYQEVDLDIFSPLVPTSKSITISC